MIRIIDCGSQLTQNIARRVRELGVFSDIVPYNTHLDSVMCDGLEGIIISGGQASVYDAKAPIYDVNVLSLGVPVLGICYGQQSIAHLLGGKVEGAKNREYGSTRITVTKPEPLFSGVDDKEFEVWMSHGDAVLQMPEGFIATAQSQGGHIAAMQNASRKIYAVQFHPEVDHTRNGEKILDNYLSLCNARRDWTSANFISSAIESIRKQVGEGKAIAGISGGVDSTTLSLLMQKALGERFTGIFVNNGLLRKDEEQEVLQTLGRLGMRHAYVDASERFLRALEDVSDPDIKRKIIGNEFIAVFDEKAKELGGATHLGQGTLYPDVIESVPVYGASSKIKRHHNVGGLPEKMGLSLVEPFRSMFKDEVRKIAEELGMPRESVWRHPFPGPGLAVRIIGPVTRKKLEILRQADSIYMEELMKRDIYYDIGQAFAVLTNAHSTGVMGDEGTYETVVALRAVTTDDFMTTDVYHFEWDALQAITNRIINEVKGVNRVVYDMTQKPPGTIEWE